VCAYVAPTLISGRGAIGPIGGEGISRLEDATRLRDIDFARLGDDLLITGYVDVHRDR
jgi:diaminohydroxyphosphoribosylaminopyrimidine deaminase/5-amino-6-(5-phosphoribosylamino)uracil reductase